MRTRTGGRSGVGAARCCLFNCLLIGVASAGPAPAQVTPTQTPPAAQTLPATTPAGPTGYHIHTVDKDRVGDVYSLQEHAVDYSHTTLSLGLPDDTSDERTEIQAGLVCHVVAADPAGHATELAVTVKSATGRSTAGEAMEPLSCVGTDLRVILYPKVHITRLDGKPIPTLEDLLWKMIFTPADPGRPMDDSATELPETVHVGDTWERDLASLGLSGAQMGVAPTTKVRWEATGTQKLGEQTYLLLNLSLSAPLDPKGKLDPALLLTSSRMDVNLELTAPTDPKAHLIHMTNSIEATFRGSYREPGIKPIPGSTNYTHRDEMTISYLPGP